MRAALIGHTGFVGSNLLRQTMFTHHYHSKTIEQICGQSFDTVVCAGAPAEKWRANQDPDTDWKNIQRLIQCLDTVQTKRMILISTVDVFETPRDVDEDSKVTTDGLGPYGKHRYWLERFAVERFDALVVRLPGLFGAGLKKNFVFDFLHLNQLERINAESVYQLYDLANLWRDIQIAGHAGLRLLHVATEPVSVADVASEVFGFTFHNRTVTPSAAYDFRSKHADLFGGNNGYLFSRATILQALRAFVAEERGQKRCA
jgi:nucleoside-diphosphate-sugar epimerase